MGASLLPLPAKDYLRRRPAFFGRRPGVAWSGFLPEKHRNANQKDQGIRRSEPQGGADSASALRNSNGT